MMKGKAYSYCEHIFLIMWTRTPRGWRLFWERFYGRNSRGKKCMQRA